MHITIVSDAWLPQVNGVVRTLQHLVAELDAMGHTVTVIGPDRFRTVRCPTYPEIRLAVLPGRRLAALLDDTPPDCLHVATEGPLGFAARRWAVRRGVRFTTSLHTRFPDYLAARSLAPAFLAWAVLRRFHAAASATLVSTRSLRRELASRGFRKLRLWPRGVDLAAFRPQAACEPGLKRPLLLTVGRVAVEKNLAAFLDMAAPGSKMVVGDGPLLDRLRRRYPDVTFTGALHGPALARAYASADAFVFPSRTDTFGLVLLESMACGTPVAAYPVPGPRDVVAPGAGALHADLAQATAAALLLDRATCRAHAERWSWRASAETFLRNLVPLRRPG